MDSLLETPPQPKLTTWGSLTATQKLRVLAFFTIIFLLISAVALLIIFLRYISTSTPFISISQFDTNPSDHDHVINYELEFMQFGDRGLHYDDVNLSFYYRKDKNGSDPNFAPMGSDWFEGFYQGRRTAYRGGEFWPSGVVWGNESVGGMVFKVELKTGVKHWDSRKRRLELAAEVQVDEDGRLNKKSRGQMFSSSGAAQINANSFGFLVVVLGVFVVFHL